MSMGIFKTHTEYEQQLFDREIDVFPLEQYISARAKIKHTCTKGHVWLVRPDDVLKGRGCPKCNKSGFDYSKPALLYHVSFKAEDIEYYKLGITNKNIQERFGSEWCELNMKLLWVLSFNTGYAAFEFEQDLLSKNSNYLINTGILRRGNTETLTCKVSKPVL